MAGIKALRKLYLGFETTAGTAVAATQIWRGTGSLVDDREVTFPDEDVADMMGIDRSYVARKGATLTLEETPATFEQLPIILALGIENLQTGVADTGGSGRIYQYDFPTTAAATHQTATFEFGDNQQAEETEYCHTESFTISGAGEEAVMVTATLQGRQVTAVSFTTGLTVPSVAEILHGKGFLYIDTVGTYPATTLKSNTLVSFEFNYNTGLIPKYTANGSDVYFGFVQSTRPDATLSVTYEHDGTATAEKIAFKAETPRSMRLKFEGAALTTTGSSYSTKTLIIDAVGKYTDFSSLEDTDGNDMVSGTLQIRNNSTAGAPGKVIVVNESASIP